VDVQQGGLTLYDGVPNAPDTGAYTVETYTANSQTQLATLDLADHTRTLTNAATISGAGAVLFAGQQINFAGTYNVSGSTKVSSGDLALQGANVTVGTTAASAFQILSGGTLSGYGSITGLVLNSGTVAPGSVDPVSGAKTTGTFVIQGDYTQYGSGVLYVKTLAGSCDQLRVSGLVTLGGWLDVDYTPGTSAQVLTFGSITGTWQIRDLGSPSSPRFTEVIDPVAKTLTLLPRS
jgi:hypothetical protein